MANPQDEEESLPKGKRIFINHLDQYQGTNIGRHLSTCVEGAALDEPEEEEETGSVDSLSPRAKEGCYEIIGTVKDSKAEKPDFAKEIVKYDHKDQLYEQLTECDIIIYDITEDPDQIDEAIWAVSALHAEIESIEKPKMFIMVSSVLTWAKSKPLDADEPDIPFTEDDYRRRRAHPNFKDHISAEKMVIKFGKTKKSKLITYVVCTGLTYGGGENIFHYLFKEAWHNAPELQCFGPGDNVVPTMHIKDLAAVIQNICDSRPKVRYIIAKDEANNTLMEIVQAVSSKLGTGKVVNINKDDSLLNKKISQADFDILLVNLRMDAVHVKENMHIQWVAESGIVENIAEICKEYKKTRKLLPFRVCILGPPGAGKSSIAKELCDKYKLHHLHIKEVVKAGMDKLEETAKRADIDEEEEDDEGRAQEATELLETIAETKDPVTGKIEDQYVIRFFRDFMKSMPCQNQGFILDGYPKITDQAREMFANDEEEEEEEGKVNYDPTLMPEFLFVFDGTEEYLRDRIMNLPETVVAGTHNTEDGFLRRYAEHRNNNSDDVTVLNYFDELEIHPERFDVTKDTSAMMADTRDKIIKAMGEPRNYGPTEEEQREMKQKADEEQIKKELAERELLEKRESEELEQRTQRQKDWAERLDEVKREEYELLEAQAIPLRNYLMKHVMPTLTQGLIDCTKVRPDDPIDYLAEYLFQNNPQID